VRQMDRHQRQSIDRAHGGASFDSMATVATIRRNALRSLIPPPRLRLSQWIESNIRLPEGVSALPRV
jgi:hypothetical protein